MRSWALPHVSASFMRHLSHGNETQVKRGHVHSPQRISCSVWKAFGLVTYNQQHSILYLYFVTSADWSTLINIISGYAIHWQYIFGGSMNYLRIMGPLLKCRMSMQASVCIHSGCAMWHTLYSRRMYRVVQKK